MPRKLKVIDVDAPTTIDDNIKVGETTINEIVVSVDVPEVLPEAPEKIKRVRAPRVKKEVIKTDEVVEPVQVVEPEQIVEPVQIAESTPVVELPKIEEPKKNNKTVELVECPNCQKK